MDTNDDMMTPTMAVQLQIFFCGMALDVVIAAAVAVE